ncbi:aminotransferase class I/II-fold pyridoxal phosphate-dependent enzyme, partial [Pseudomonas paraeruginosa]|uniref:aminotransferase class I/II-fold pyridoxal phosphate-dependent enzyme n=1 Tax=Pseudomonas paraeruginosa TaxID=2994495 RepID=UPI003A4C70A7
IGEPDFTTAEPMIVAGRVGVAAGHTRYTAGGGVPALREAIARYYGERYGVVLDPQRVLVTAGGCGGLLLASSLLVDPG